MMVEVNAEKDLAKLEKDGNVQKNFLIERPKRSRPRMIVYDVPTSVDKSSLARKILA